MALFRKVTGEPLAVTMAGVKLGLRLLALGTHDTALVAQLAAKTGLTGRACVVDDDDARLAAAAAAIEKEGALVETARAPYGMLPFDDASFDIAVIPAVLPVLAADTRARCAAEILRVLRPGGRALAIEAGPKRGLSALLSRQTPDPAYAGPIATLKAAGFTAVRQLAEADGMLYVEGIKHG
jgi:ubiquinone/menaquinone biosynthesis C-methylase UbiE